MADTLSERLRRLPACEICQEAAAELDRREARLTALEQALKEIAEMETASPQYLRSMARAALKG